MTCDAHTFTRIFNGYKAPFIRYATAYIHDPMTAEDIVMEAMMNFWIRHEDLPDDTDLPAYILTAVRNKSIDFLRKEMLRQQISGDLSETAEWEISQRLASIEAEGFQDIFAQDIRSIVDGVLEAMPERSRKIFSMSRLDGLDQKRIASELGITVKGVQFHITRILNAMRKALKEYL